MNKKFILSLIFSFLIFSISASAVTVTKYEMNRQTNVITVEGTANEKSNVVIQILNPSKNLSDLQSATEETYGETVNTFYQVKSDKEGKFTCSFEMNAVSGQKYYLHVTCGGESLLYDVPMTYFSQQDISDTVKFFNEEDLTDEDVVSLMDSSKEIIGINTQLYDNLTPEEKLIVAGDVLNEGALMENGFKKPEEIINVTGKSASLCILNRTDDTEKAKTLIDSLICYAGKGESGIYTIYKNDLKKETQENIINLLINEKPYENCETMIKKFSQNILLAKIENLENYNDVYSLLEENHGLIDGFNFSLYKKLDDTSSVDKAIAGKTFTISELSETLNKAVEEEKEDSTPTTKPGGGGGGGGGGGAAGSNSTVNAPITLTQETPEAESAKEFSDLGNTAWAEEAINALYKKGIVSGKKDGIFAPSDNVTRGEFVKMIVNAFEIKGSCRLSFEDVSSNDWQYPYISAAFENGIITGRSESVFGVNENITREDMAVILARVFKGEIASGELSYNDKESISDYAKDSVAKMSAKGYMQGRGNGNFAPKENATRAEAAKVIYTIMTDNWR